MERTGVMKLGGPMRIIKIERLRGLRERRPWGHGGTKIVPIDF
jgi:hypothetical protein